MVIKRILAAIIGVSLLAVMPLASAQQQSGSGLSISPTRVELIAEPGKTVTSKISLKNVSGTDITAKVFVNDFESDNETGEPRILVDNTEKTATSIKGFLPSLTDVNLKKDESKDVVVKVQVPDKMPPGAYYGIIRFAAIPAGTPEAELGQVSLTASVGTLMLIEVPGDIVEQIEVNRIRAYQGSRAGNFFIRPPDQIGVDIKNSGNGFAKPFGRVTITNRGKEVFSYELNNTEPRGNVLPDSSRVFKNAIQNVSGFGHYKVLVNVAYDNGGEVIDATGSFWVVPMWVFIVGGILLLVIIVSGILLYRWLARRPHRRNRH